MIHINFFEKKKINILPYIVAGVFLLLLLIMGLYFFFSRTHYEQIIEDKNQWIDNHREEVVLSRRMDQIDRLTNQTLSVQENLSENQYPMNRVASDIVSIIPDEGSRVASFQLSEPGQVSLILENTETTLGQDIVEDLEAISFVTGVQFLYAESQTEDTDNLRYEFIIDLNEGAIVEGEPE